MKVKEILFAGISGTTFMTAFSYAVSTVEKENFSEPERLGQFAHRLLPAISKKENQLIGWSAHYGMGLLFSTAYDWLWANKKVKPSFKNNLILGGISGLAAVAIWKTTFKMHPLPPRLSFDKYYLQLVPAHIVFAVFAGLAYKVLSTTSSAKPGEEPPAINAEVEES
ncbi:MAG TPA: hypothetical protein VNW95_05615 [Mucilaginibacter sp.]|jgi:hypothetical protein|nr:hypothetical protein [Mucilaginibacter sp.]